VRRRSVVVAACCGFALTILASTAVSTRAESATSQQPRGFDCGITSPPVVAGRSVFPQLRTLHASFLVLPIEWATVAPAKPLNARDPEDPAYVWTTLDPTFVQASASGIEIVPEILATPAWANGGRAPQFGPTKPTDYADFVIAVATRYPQIRRWMIWGEPSRPQQWLPQGRAGARQYALLLDVAYRAIKRIDPNDIVIGGNTLRGGPDTKAGTSPKTWLKWLVMPNGHRPRFDEWGHNPFTQRRIDLRLRPVSRLTYDFDDLDSLAADLDRFYPRKQIRLFLSESGTPTEHGNAEWFYYTSRADQARRMTQMFQAAQAFPRIAAISNFLLRDEPGVSGWTTGLLTATGARKPSWNVYRKVCGP
jgi:hypothetical protein